MKPLLYQLIEQLYYLNVSGILVGQLDVSIHSGQYDDVFYITILTVL